MFSAGDDASRRRLLQRAGIAFGAVGIAGCIGGSGGNGNSLNSQLDTASVNRIDEYLSDNNARLYDGEIADKTGESQVGVKVGAGGDGFAFDPPALHADTGTEIVWEWTGASGGHNVVPASDSDFDEFGDRAVVSEAGYSIGYRFEQSGIGLYLCVPHSGVGMVGAFVIE